MKFDKLKEKTYRVEINFGDGDILTLSRFRPYANGMADAKALQQRIEETEDEGEIREAVFSSFCSQVLDWDGEDREGNKIELSVAGLNAAADSNLLPIRVLGDILAAAYEQVETVKKPRPRR